jgi:hypothetical protein
MNYLVETILVMEEIMLGDVEARRREEDLKYFISTMNG